MARVVDAGLAPAASLLASIQPPTACSLHNRCPPPCSSSASNKTATAPRARRHARRTATPRAERGAHRQKSRSDGNASTLVLRATRGPGAPPPAPPACRQRRPHERPPQGAALLAEAATTAQGSLVKALQTRCRDVATPAEEVGGTSREAEGWVGPDGRPARVAVVLSPAAHNGWSRACTWPSPHQVRGRRRRGLYSCRGLGNGTEVVSKSHHTVVAPNRSINTGSHNNVQSNATQALSTTWSSSDTAAPPEAESHTLLNVSHTEPPRHVRMRTSLLWPFERCRCRSGSNDSNDSKWDTQARTTVAPGGACWWGCHQAQAQSP